VGYTDGRSMYFGCVVGRFANRLKEGKFSLDGKDYKLPAINNGPNALHGGAKGWSQVHWEVLESGEKDDGPFVTFGYLSKDGEEGYPGEVYAKVRYSIVGGNTLKMEYTVEHKAGPPTIVNVTNHTYFNLAGHPQEGQIADVMDHHLAMTCEAFTVVDSTSIPTGEIRPVAGTPFDFTGAGRRIGERIGESYEQLRHGGPGYDHNFVLPEALQGTMQLCARVSEPTSGRKLECHTTEPGVQLYTGNFMIAENPPSGKGQPLAHRTGFCLETQHFPDSPNHPSFPSTRLGPGEIYQSATEYRFSAA